MSKTNTGLVAYAKAQVGKPYYYGTFGQKADKSLYDSKKKQYPDHYKWGYPIKDNGIKVHDCVGLIKGYLWCDSATATPKYNANQDVSANGMYSKCTKKGKIKTIPEVPGVLVFMDKHVGVYIGSGEVIEARGHAYGVVKTKLKDRPWKNWGYCSYITYEVKKAESKPTTAQKNISTAKSNVPTFKVGSTYILQVDLKVRTGAGINCAQKKRNKLTADGKKNAKIGIYAALKKGTKVTVKGTKKVGSDIWIQIPSGWIAGYYNGKTYIK